MREYIIQTLKKLIESKDDQSRIKIILEELKKMEINSKVVEINEEILDERFYTPNENEFGKKCIEAKIITGSKKTVLLNTHFDTVPCEAMMKKAILKEGIIYGRGACDALGQITLILATLKKLKESGSHHPDLILQFVNCEETGGNGTLSLLRRLEKTNFGIVFEPTNLEINDACRGALWFRINVHGLSSHMGRFDQGDNAIYKMKYILDSLEKYWQNLIKTSKKHEYFKHYKMPVQMNFGAVEGGLINASLPDRVTLKGALGFLSNKNIDEIKKDFNDVIRKGLSDYLKKFNPPKIKKHFDLIFDSLHNDPYELKEYEREIIFLLEDSFIRELKKKPIIRGFPASCDSRLIYLRNKIPVVVFGPGKLEHAHSENEQIKLRDIEKAVKVLFRFLNER